MCEKHGLRTLKMRVRRDHCVRMPCREPDKRTLTTPYQHDRGINFVSAPKSECCRHLIVSAAAGVQLSTGVTDLLDKLCLDERMDILGLRRAEIGGVFTRFIQ